jgi:hypothetical protein
MEEVYDKRECMDGDNVVEEGWRRQNGGGAWLLRLKMKTVCLTWQQHTHVNSMKSSFFNLVVDQNASSTFCSTPFDRK